MGDTFQEKMITIINYHQRETTPKGKDKVHVMTKV